MQFLFLIKTSRKDKFTVTYFDNKSLFLHRRHGLQFFDDSCRLAASKYT